MKRNRFSIFRKEIVRCQTERNGPTDRQTDESVPHITTYTILYLFSLCLFVSASVFGCVCDMCMCVSVLSPSSIDSSAFSYIDTKNTSFIRTAALLQLLYNFV